MSFTDPSTSALEQFGYTARQAAFLALVARHGGYFLRRQYVAFTGHSHGLATVRFLRQLVARNHARPVLVRAGHAFHLYARPLYAALADEHNRNRRAAEWDAVDRKLLTVDFVLGRLGDMFYATEAEKSAHLDSLRAGRDLWPSRVYAPRTRGGAPTTRYFVDKMPWHRMPGESRVWFAYVDTEQTLSGFETFLTQYRPLLSVLSSGVTYVARSVDSRAVTARFTRVLARRTPFTPTLRDLVFYFRVRRDIETGRSSYPTDGSRFGHDLINRLATVRYGQGDIGPGADVTSRNSGPLQELQSLPRARTPLVELTARRMNRERTPVAGQGRSRFISLRLLPSLPSRLERGTVLGDVKGALAIARRRPPPLASPARGAG
jgi:hypothetical protein